MSAPESTPGCRDAGIRVRFWVSAIAASVCAFHSAFGADPSTVAACVLARDLDEQDGWCGVHWEDSPAAGMALEGSERQMSMYTRPGPGDKLVDGLAFSEVTYFFSCNHLQSVLLHTRDKEGILAALQQAYGDPFGDVKPRGQSELTWKGHVVSMRITFDPDHAEVSLNLSNDEMLWQASQRALQARVLGIQLECPPTVPSSGPP